MSYPSFSLIKSTPCCSAAPSSSMPPAKAPRPPLDMYVIVLIVWAVIMLLCLLRICVGPIYERDAFNRFTTGPKATYMDALCCELRVEAKQ